MRPETKALYPTNWPEISHSTIQARGSRCEACGHNKEDDGKVLTVHHIDYDPSNNDPANLVVLCQGCHLRRQARELSEAARVGKIEKLIAMGQLCLPGFELPQAKNYVQALRARAGATPQRNRRRARLDNAL